ncbi:tyrosine-type recombinase/integrase [Vibrio cholerae]|uniref:tyrosine-type recombinase/integrase n=1 Tax=Vibrio cholerae TaxID=666 RepID=UPI0009D6BC50|nr:tyrosine-type recombinase/integrase [Vibrio cholerae]PNM40576.1 integrase [Vibrio cholerae]TQO79525.1 tyrosine-type recombinase/integrase [Vibrio cholerae]TQP47293.1 tyrosine-type recombinase/integrase [Vibrio cholerae]TQP78531.1 tyrosine-type recombinase/integrase [Vibrio cholerae]
MWTALCKKGGVRYLNQYQLRHTYASWMITHANVNVSYLAQQMGHADITMVARVYGKWLVESNKKESERNPHNSYNQLGRHDNKFLPQSELEACAN